VDRNIVSRAKKVDHLARLRSVEEKPAEPQNTYACCMIDRSEVFIERPSSLLARAQTYSNYKSHNTIKFLVAISSTRAVISVSKCWGGRMSD